MRGISESNLNLLFRKAVLKLFGNRCFFCKKHLFFAEIEVHHTVKRRNFLLRYNWRNGIPVCKWIHSENEHMRMSCHHYAETPAGKAKIAEYQAPFLDYLTDRSGQAKQWLVEHGMTKNEYKASMLKELKEILNEQSER